MNTARAASIPAAIVAALAVAPPAVAHVTLNPREWEAGGFARFAVRVPNERDGAATTKITLRFPEQILSASFQPVEGWTRTVRMVKLDKPIDIDGNQVNEKIDTVTWSGGRIRPGEFQEFGLSIRMPSKPGVELAFPAIQTYAGGEVVRWIGPSDADQPAPRVTVTKPESDEEGAAAPAATPGETARQGSSDTLSIVALVVAIAALATGFAAILGRGRQSQTTRPRTEDGAR